MVSEQTVGQDASFALVAGLPAHRPRKMCRVIPFGSAGDHKQLRTRFPLLYCGIALSVGVPEAGRQDLHRLPLIPADRLLWVALYRV
jgi:hypothetical protein